MKIRSAVLALLHVYRRTDGRRSPRLQTHLKKKKEMVAEIKGNASLNR
jgi:hypothetical protein